MMQLHNKPHKIGLYLNIGASLLCLLMVVRLAYQKNRYSYPVKIIDTSTQRETSITTSEYENITDDLPNQIDDIHAFVNVIRQQSKEQLRTRQQKNNDPTFKPERLITTFFKQFNGDKSAMKRY